MSKIFFNYINLNINEGKKVLIFFLIFIFFVSVVSIVYTLIFVQKNSYLVDDQLNIIINNIPFNWGPLMENIYSNFKFSQPGYNFEFYLKKLPLNALYLVIILKISKNIYIFMLIKNIITSSLIFYFTYLFTKNNKKNFMLFLFILSSFFIIPYNTSVIFNFVYGDHLTSFLVPLLFLSLVSIYQKNYHIIGLLIFILYFTKPSMFFICLTIPFIIILFEDKKNDYKKFIPFIYLLIAIFSWGIYGLSKTNSFPFGKNLLSNNSFDFSAITNSQFSKIYPNIGVDSIDVIQNNKNTMKNENFENEWEYYNYYNKRNILYLKKNLDEYLKTIPKKIYFIFFRINKDNMSVLEYKSQPHQVRYSNIINKLSLNFSVLLALYILIKNYKNFLNFRIEIYYLSLVLLNILPHLYGWATNKHLVGIFIISNLYLVLKFFKFKEDYP